MATAVPQATIRVVDTSGNVLATLFGGGAVSTAGTPIGLLLVLTKAA